MASPNDTSRITSIAKSAKIAFEESQLIDPSERFKALLELRKELESQQDAILQANDADMEVGSNSVSVWSILTRSDRLSTKGCKGRGPRRETFR